MAYDGLVNYVVIKELKEKIIGGKIDKIFQPNNQEIILGVYANGVKTALNAVISSYYRLCTTSNIKQNPTFAPNFCMVLRKHLLNNKIIDIYSLGLERICVIELEGKNKNGDFGIKKLYIELMGKHSNIILTDENNMIIDSLKHFNISDSCYRNILPNYKYLLPISNKMDILNLDTNVYDFILSHLNFECASIIDAFSSVFTGLSKEGLSIIQNNLNISNEFNKENTNVLYEYILNILSNPNNVCIFELDNSYGVINSSNNFNVNSFIDNYYYSKEFNEAFINYKQKILKMINTYLKKSNTILDNINRKLKECENTDKYRIYGELITNNLYRLDNKNVDRITIENYYDNNKFITIPLDKTFTPSINAKRFFKKYNKLKNTVDIVEKQKLLVLDDIKYLESILFSIDISTSISELENIYFEFEENVLKQNIHLKLNKKHLKNPNQKNKKILKNTEKKLTPFGEPHKFIIDNFTIFVGKNNKQNDYITKNAKSTDIWFHTQDIHGSHVILKIENTIPSQETINKIASIAAFYSKGRSSSNVAVDYCQIKYVKKPSNSKPGMVTYYNNKNVIVKPKNVNL